MLKQEQNGRPPDCCVEMDTTNNESEPKDTHSSSNNSASKANNKINRIKHAVEDGYTKNKKLIHRIINLILIVGYFVYFGFAMAYEFGSTESITLLWVTCVVVFGILLSLFLRHCGWRIKESVPGVFTFFDQHGQKVLWFVLTLYISNFFHYIVFICHFLFGVIILKGKFSK